MANQSINDFIRGFKGGTRLNRFEVIGNIGPGSGTDNLTTPFHIRSASLPEATVGAITINHRGRAINYSGDRTYLPWEITILDDHAGGQNDKENLYKKFHDWHERINSHGPNITTFSVGTDPSSLWSQSWTVKQYETNCNTALPGRTFKLFNVWPIGVGPLQLDMSQDNILASFAVTLVYSHYTYDGAPFTTQAGT
jgi:hypothetical protein